MTANKVERRNHDKILPEVGHSIAFFVLLVASSAATRCGYNFYQRKVPDQLKSARKS